MTDHLTLYHGLSQPYGDSFRFEALSAHPEGIHLGSHHQAQMRAGPGQVIAVRLDLRRAGRISRVKDHPVSWAATLKRKQRAGCKALVYLNRFEGLSLDTVTALARADTGSIDHMSDRSFRALAPDAEDSFVVLDPEIVEILGPVTEAPSALPANGA